ncbi:hypothetical protein BZG36_00210 [Bifiguratus adelaidae]|uniref:Uncharacterized protein n=1 Tax=Bifiguratus adelaidae TaxID=1938954 RepID=A0A261Y8B8_9FUNG|nr:hypothetical protein BZG36_00210 [Bifiguratus adelaidae]
MTRATEQKVQARIAGVRDLAVRKVHPHLIDETGHLHGQSTGIRAEAQGSGLEGIAHTIVEGVQDSGSSSDSSGSGSDTHHRRHRHHRERRKSQDRDRKKKSKHRHSHKKDRKKKHKKEKRSSHVASYEWGKYGIIYENDIYSKEQEFQAWLVEVKKMNPELITPAKSKELFQGFIEDYNTATMPHEKYYNLEKWEARQRALRMGEKPPPDDDTIDLRKDEEALRSSHRQQSNKTPPTTMLSNTQLEDLRRIQNERVMGDRMRKLGMKVKEGFGVRYESEF